MIPAFGATGDMLFDSRWGTDSTIADFERQDEGGGNPSPLARIAAKRGGNRT